MSSSDGVLPPCCSGCIARGVSLSPSLVSSLCCCPALLQWLLESMSWPSSWWSSGWSLPGCCSGCSAQGVTPCLPLAAMSLIAVDHCWSLASLSLWLLGGMSGTQASSDWLVSSNWMASSGGRRFGASHSIALLAMACLAMSLLWSLAALAIWLLDSMALALSTTGWQCWAGGSETTEVPLLLVALGMPATQAAGGGLPGACCAWGVG